VSKFRSKVVDIEAVQYTGGIHSADKTIAWAIEKGVGPGMRYVRLGDTIDIPTSEGVMSASRGDWIICGTEGEFYPCKPSVFERKYEPLGVPV
jgi:hypothetical protein